MKLSKSVKSVTSLRSVRTTDTRRGDTGDCIDLPTMLPTVCARLECPCTIVVKRVYQEELCKPFKRGDSTPRRIKFQQHGGVITESSEVTSSVVRSTETAGAPMGANTITISAVYDPYNCLTEIILYKIQVPRILIQVIGLFAPYYQNLTTLTIRQCRIDLYTIHEMSKILEISTITNINLCNSPVLQRSYERLLKEKSTLRSLTLCGCKLNDEDCEQLAAKLHYGSSADNLQFLNLSSNRITDAGVKYISDALRSNRHLLYLNLADNQIDDEGAGYLFSILIEFPLTHEEVSNMRIRYMKYLRCRRNLYAGFLNEGDRLFDVHSHASLKTVKKLKSVRQDKGAFGKFPEEDAKKRAESLATEMLGQFNDPFSYNSINRRDNSYYSEGNLVLCYLNMAYNNLSYLSLKQLLNVVRYQQNHTKRVNQNCLVKIVIDGNNLPMCEELLLLNELFGRNIKHVTGKTQSRRKTETDAKRSF